VRRIGMGIECHSHVLWILGGAFDFGYLLYSVGVGPGRSRVEWWVWGGGWRERRGVEVSDGGSDHSCLE